MASLGLLRSPPQAPVVCVLLAVESPKGTQGASQEGVGAEGTPRCGDASVSWSCSARHRVGESPSLKPEQRGAGRAGRGVTPGSRGQLQTRLPDPLAQGWFTVGRGSRRSPRRGLRLGVV